MYLASDQNFKGGGSFRTLVPIGCGASTLEYGRNSSGIPLRLLTGLKLWSLVQGSAFSVLKICFSSENEWLDDLLSYLRDML